MDWTQVDLVDAGIGVIGLIANGAAIVVASSGNIPAAGVIEGVGGVVEFGGLIKSGYEATTGDPTSQLLQQTTNQTQNTTKLFIARGGRIIPFLGFLGNLGSLYLNLQPQIDVHFE